MGRSAWLDRVIKEEYLPFIRSLENTQSDRVALTDFTNSMRERWSNVHNKPQLTQQQRLMDMTRRAIKDALGENHWSLSIVKLSKSEYTHINDLKQGRVAERNERVQFLDRPDEIVSRAVELLDRPDWADVAAGLAVLTGRRSAELLSTANFEVVSQRSLIFTGAVKRRGEKGLAFEIPTLTDANRVVDAIALLRRELPDAIQLSAKDVNAKYGQAVARACDRHFSDLVPTRLSKDSLYTHLFRSIYATIATFWYCPPSVNETEFKAAIQGHFQILDEANPELRRSLAASRHYSDYEIADEIIAKYKGKRKGIKLGDEGVRPIAMFAHSDVKPTEESRTKRAKVAQLRIFQDDRERWIEVLQLFSGGNQQQKSSQLLAWIEERLARSEKSQQEQSELKSLSSETLGEPVEIDKQPCDVQSERVLSAPTSTYDDPLRQDLHMLIAAISNLVSLQQAALSGTNTSTRSSSVSVASSSQEMKTRTKGSLDAEEKNSSHRVKSSRSDSQKLIDSWIEAIMNYNNARARRHDDKWAITISLLKSLGGSQPRVVQTLQQRQDIHQHHQFHQLDPSTHNLKHRGKHKITDLIQL
jgi:hypothetical protein